MSLPDAPEPAAPGWPDLGYVLRENAPLIARNTFAVPARAELLADVRNLLGLESLLAAPWLAGMPMLVLGGGSNLLLVDDVPGLVLSLALTGIRITEEDEARVRVVAEAGERWDELVRWTVARGLYGLENLALIPGSVGASPIQNIGAYGVEVAEHIAWVEAFDREGGCLRRLDARACGFAYRDSRFRREAGQWIVLRVAFDLARGGTLRLDYAGVREELAAMGIERPRPSHVAEAISRIRARRLPLPDLLGNAGSFFKNPEVPEALAEALAQGHPGIPNWPAAAGQRKLSAAWLIEQAGWRGHREGPVGVSAQHALVLVNHGGATGAQVLALARKVAASVQARFGVALEPEPILVGARW